MSMTIDELTAEAMSLPREAQAMLADRLVESLDEVPGGLVDELWAAEARRRLDEVRSGLMRTIPGGEAAARVRQAVGQ